jgi:hypothetical protein
VRKISPLAKLALALSSGVGHNSSQVTKGKQMFVELGDARSAWARRWADLILAHVNDLGGAEMLSETQISICRRVSAIECELEAMEARMSAGEVVDPDHYGRLAGRLCRLFELIGIKRLARPLDPLGDLAKAFESHVRAIDDDEPNDDEPLPIEEERNAAIV